MFISRDGRGKKGGERVVKFCLFVVSEEESPALIREKQCTSFVVLVALRIALSAER